MDSTPTKQEPVTQGCNNEESQREKIFPPEILHELEVKEITPGKTLTLQEYAHLLINYVVQHRLIEAKFCYMRAAEKFPKNQILFDIWHVGLAMSRVDFQTALQYCCLAVNECTDQSFSWLKPYIRELSNRLTAEQLKLIARCYDSICVAKLIELLVLYPVESSRQIPSGKRALSSKSVSVPSDPSDKMDETDPHESVLDIIKRCGWEQLDSTNSDFIRPNNGPKFKEAISSFYDSQYGPNLDDKPAQDDKPLTKSLNITAEMKSLLSSSLFFDKPGVGSG